MKENKKYSNLIDLKQLSLNIYARAKRENGGIYARNIDL